MKLSANEIRVGNILEIDGRLKVVSKIPEHTKPGKGPAYVQLELKDLVSGTKSNMRLNSSSMVDKVRLDSKEYQYLYSEDDKLVLMDTETYEQIFVDIKILDKKVAFLEDNMVISLISHEGNPIDIKLPDTVTLEIVETDPVIKGSTVTSSYKPAILNNGLKVSVPPYLTSGEKIVVKTSDSSFVERVKS